MNTAVSYHGHRRLGLSPNRRIRHDRRVRLVRPAHLPVQGCGEPARACGM